MDRQISGNWIRLHKADDAATPTVRDTAVRSLDTA